MGIKPRGIKKTGSTNSERLDMAREIQDMTEDDLNNLSQEELMDKIKTIGGEEAIRAALILQSLLALQELTMQKPDDAYLARSYVDAVTQVAESGQTEVISHLIGTGLSAIARLQEINKEDDK